MDLMRERISVHHPSLLENGLNYAYLKYRTKAFIKNQDEQACKTVIVGWNASTMIDEKGVDHLVSDRKLVEEMTSFSRKATGIFVARIGPSVTESEFRIHFEEYGEITDLYMPKNPSTKGHRGIGFITFTNAESVDNTSHNHELGGSTAVVDRATPKEDDYRPVSTRVPHRGGGGEGYGAYNAYITAATRYADLGAPTLYDHPSSLYGRGAPSRLEMSSKIFVGRLPQEATVEDLCQYFCRFGRILDAYLPKDPKKSGHRGFGFVTFFEDGVADRVSRRDHEICGQQIQLPVDDAGPGGSYDVGFGGRYAMDNVEPYVGGYSPLRGYSRMYRGMDFDDWSYGMIAARPSRANLRYHPY